MLLDDDEDVHSSISPVLHNKYQITRKSISAHNSDRSRSKSPNTRSNCTFPTMHVDDKLQSARMSENSSVTPGKDQGGLSIPNFNNNQSV